MPSTRLLTRQIAALIYEMAQKVEALEQARPGNEHAVRLMFNTVAASRNIQHLMDPRDVERESA